MVYLTFDLEGLATATRQVRHLEAQSGKWLTCRPAESEQPGAEINYFQNQQSTPKHLFNKNSCKAPYLNHIKKTGCYKQPVQKQLL
ncbi:hypothetical protein ABE65_002050 [Fictibacillus phosphorivorans]|uniref:Uncharacterized protein n=1 Tax=Fictibacillus phosphorivorans TaxID=1221500 RepID=A0A160II90_9BACL|nr:hypothetical protein ABE65_002050 [Fictibacillus phosphorivorans]